MVDDVIDHRLLEPIESLWFMVRDLPVHVTEDEEIGEIEHKPEDLLLSAAAGGAFIIYAHNPMTGRTHALETGQVFQAWADFVMFPTLSVALFFDDYEPFGDALIHLPVPTVVARCCHWRGAHRVPADEEVFEKFLRLWLGDPLPALFPMPIYMLAVVADGLNDAARDIRREHAAFGKGKVAKRIHVPGTQTGSRADRLAMTSAEVARAMGVPEQTLRRWRSENRGPPWFKVGDGRSGKVLYRREAVEKWMKEQEGNQRD